MSFRRESLSLSDWPAIYAMLVPAVGRAGDTNPHEMIDELIADRAQLWIKRDDGEIVATAVTTLHDDGSLHFQLLGGRGLETWVDGLIATVIEEPKPIPVSKLSETGRPGWQRVLSRRGWHFAGRDEDGSVTMELRL